MDVTPLVKQGSQIIQSYAGGVFKISGKVYPGGVIVTASSVLDWAAPAQVSDLRMEHFVPLTQTFSLQGSGDDCGFDVILLGTGSALRFPDPALKIALKAQGLPGFDVMDTGAACRTYNVLLAEGRRVVALLMPVKA